MSLSLELLLMIAHHMRDDHGELRYGDFNSFLQVNRALYSCLNHMLWKEATEYESGTQRVFTYLIKTNNTAALSFVLEQGADVEVRLPDIDITTLECDCDQVGCDLELEPIPLLIVTYSDNAPLAHLLLEKDAKIEYFDQDNFGKFSPIHAARSAEMVQLLLEYGADPNYGDENGRTPLHWYAIRDEIAPMRAILHHGAEVNTDGDFEKPIHEAAQRNLDTVQLLVAHGADVRGRDMNGNTPLHLAVRAGKTDVVKFLVEQWPEGTRVTNERQATPLRLAAAAREVDLAKFLVEQWPEGMRERDDCLNMPLHWAALGGQTELVELLVEGWPEGVREKNRFGDTPLHLAAMHTSRKAKTDSKTMRLLLERWPEGNEALNNDGKTPLWWFEDSKLQSSDEGREGIDEAKEKAFFTYFWCALD